MRENWDSARRGSKTWIFQSFPPYPAYFVDSLSAQPPGRALRLFLGPARGHRGDFEGLFLFETAAELNWQHGGDECTLLLVVYT